MAPGPAHRHPGDPGLPAGAADFYTRALMERWPFVGRDVEFAGVTSSLNDGASVVLLGPAGIGKTRLAGEVSDGLAAAGVTTRRVFGISSARTIPLMALRPIIGDASSGDLVAPIHDALGLGSHRPGPGDPVIVVDDAALLDDASVAVLLQVHAAGRVRLLLTMRPDQVVGSTLTPLLRDERVRSITITTLEADGAASLVAAALGGGVDGRTSALIIDAARGNAMLLRELVIGAVASGGLSQRHGLWTLTGPLPSTPVLEDLVAERVATLTKDELGALELLVVGGVLRLDLLAAASGIDTVERLERAGVVRVIDGMDGTAPSVDVAHPLYRDVLGERLGALARLRCNRQLAELSRDHEPDSPDDVLQTAVWQLLGGLELDADQALDAGRAASLRKDPNLAADLALASYRARPTAHATILASWSLAATGRQRQAIDLLREAATQVTEPDGRAALALRLAEELWWWARDPEGARRVLDEGIISLGPGQWADLLRVQPSVFAALNGDGRDAIMLAEPFADHELLWVRRIASIGLGFGLVMCDRGDEAIAVSERAFVDALSDPLQALSGDPAIHIVCRLFAGLYGPNSADTLELAKSIYAVALTQPAEQPRAWAAMLLGMAHLAHGQAISAARLLTEAELLWSDCQIQGLARWSVSSAVLAHLTAGDPTAAKEARERQFTYDQTGFAFNRPFEDRAAAHLAALAGNATTARNTLVDAAIREAERGSTIVAGDCLYELVRIGQGATAAAHLHLLSDAPGALNAARIALIGALELGDGASIEAAAETFGSMGRNLEAAEAWSLAASAYESQATQGAAKQAAAATAKAATYAARCEGARPPLLAERRTNAVLTGREFEIASMAANGLTNRAIADRLVVSERTVESHLYRVFAKLSVTSRDRLAEAITGLG